MAALGVFGTTAVTAITAQNTVTVAAVHRVPPAMVDQQIAAVLADLPVAAVKTGMLASVETIEVVSKRAAAGELPNLVVDPVMVASTGRPLIEDDGIDAYRRHLLGHALVVTPNLWEAAMLAGLDPATVTDVEDMARVARHRTGSVPAGYWSRAAICPGWVHRRGAPPRPRWCPTSSSTGARSPCCPGSTFRPPTSTAVAAPCRPPSLLGWPQDATCPRRCGRPRTT